MPTSAIIWKEEGSITLRTVLIACSGMSIAVTNMKNKRSFS